MYLLATGKIFFLCIYKEKVFDQLFIVLFKNRYTCIYKYVLFFFNTTGIVNPNLTQLGYTYTIHIAKDLSTTPITNRQI